MQALRPRLAMRAFSRRWSAATLGLYTGLAVGVSMKPGVGVDPMKLGVLVQIAVALWLGSAVLRALYRRSFGLVSLDRLLGPPPVAGRFSAPGVVEDEPSVWVDPS